MNLEDRLSSSDFEVNGYIKDIAFRFDSSDDLLKHKKQIQSVAERTAQKLKQNVYQNYALFIDTSREISALEAEMYQLSHLLNEHQGLTSAIQAINTVSSKEQMSHMEGETQEKHTIASLLETVEGSSTVTEVPGRYVVYVSNLIEMDPQTLESVQTVRAFLLNDSLMLATLIKAKRKGPIKYHFQALYELDNLAIVDVKDTEKMKHLFQIRMFPDSHMFQADSEVTKSQWMKQLESTKQKLVTERDTLKQVEVQMTNTMGSRRLEPSNRGMSGFRVLQRQPTEMASPNWVKDAPENLDVFIAQREFDQAVHLIERVKRHLKDCSDQIALRDIRARVNHRVNLLGEVLMKELQSSPSGSLRGGPRAARRAISLLLRLGRAAKACELFLENHSRVTDHELRQIKMEGATTIYITNVSTTFFASLQNAAKEFKEAFQNNSSSYSAFVTWSIKEVDLFLNNYCIESIFPPVKSNLNFAMVAECVATIRQQCQILLKSGLDLDFKVMNFLHSYLSQALIDARELLEEKLSTLGKSDTWDPKDCRQNEAQVAEILLQLENIGVPSPSNLVNDNIVDLSETTFRACQNILSYVDSFLKVHTPELLETFIDCLSDIFRHIIVAIIGEAMGEDALLPKTDFLLKNAELLILSALPALAIKIQKHINQDIPEMVELQQELKDHMELVKSGMSVRYVEVGGEDEDENEYEEDEV